jgi:hypothetical protein
MGRNDSRKEKRRTLAVALPLFSLVLDERLAPVFEVGAQPA